MIKYLTKEELEEGLSSILASPKDKGVLELIVCRPKENERNVLNTGDLSVSDGLIGDNWKDRGSKRTADKSSHPEMQLNIMNSRCIHLLTQDKSRWQLAGDQLFVDLDLSDDNLPAGTKLEIGSATIEITSIPHLGCRKFIERFGKPAMLFVNSEVGKKHNLRGVNAKVIKEGTIKIGDSIRVLH